MSGRSPGSASGSSQGVCESGANTDGRTTGRGGSGTMFVVPQSGHRTGCPTRLTIGCMMVSQRRHLSVTVFGSAAISWLGRGCSSASHSSYCSPSSAAGMFFGFGGGGGGISVRAPQSGHLSFLPTSPVRANSRVLQTRQSKPTCSGTAGAASCGLGG